MVKGVSLLGDRGWQSLLSAIMSGFSETDPVHFSCFVKIDLISTPYLYVVLIELTNLIYGTGFKYEETTHFLVLLSSLQSQKTLVISLKMLQKSNKGYRIFTS